MNDIFRAMCYRIVKSRILLYAIVMYGALGFVLPFLAVNVDDSIHGIGGTVDNLFFTSNMMGIVFINMYNGADFKNKTIYHEVMGGKRRSRIVLGRTIALLLFSELLIHLMVMLGSISLFRLESFREGVFLGNLFLKLLAVEMVELAYLCFYIMCTFVTGQMLGSLMIAWLGFCLTTVVGLADNLFNIAGFAPSALGGIYVPKHILLDAFHYEQCMYAILIALIILIFSVLAGVKCFEKKAL